MKLWLLWDCGDLVFPESRAFCQNWVGTSRKGRDTGASFEWQALKELTVTYGLSSVVDPT